MGGGALALDWRRRAHTPMPALLLLFMLLLNRRLACGIAIGPTCTRGAAGQRVSSNRAMSTTRNGYDAEGFDPEADTVGAGIYSGAVKRDEKGEVMWGRQYKDHNKQPGPVYAGTGYTAMARAIQAGPDAVQKLLEGGADPDELMTGGARPLHTCGMSRTGQLSTQMLIDAGADIEAVDTYGYTPLHRMASNDLPIGAQALLQAGADPNRKTVKPYAGDTALRIAMQSGAREVAAVLRQHGAKQ